MHVDVISDPGVMILFHERIRERRRSNGVALAGEIFSLLDCSQWSGIGPHHNLHHNRNGSLLDLSASGFVLMLLSSRLGFPSVWTLSSMRSFPDTVTRGESLSMDYRAPIKMPTVDLAHSRLVVYMGIPTEGRIDGR